MRKVTFFLVAFLSAPGAAFALDCAPGQTRAVVDRATTSFNGVQISVAGWSGLRETYAKTPLTRPFDVQYGQVTLTSNVPELTGSYDIERGALFNVNQAFCGGKPVNLQCSKLKYDPATQAFGMECSIAIYTRVAIEP